MKGHRVNFSHEKTFSDKREVRTMMKTKWSIISFCNYFECLPVLEDRSLHWSIGR